MQEEMQGGLLLHSGLPAHVLHRLHVFLLESLHPRLPSTPSPSEIAGVKRAHWDRLEDAARRVVNGTLAELPPELQPAARAVPCLLQEWCEDDPELLGIYSDFSPGEVSAANGPIILYLAAIEEFCLDEGADFEDEVRLTYLHELGHHFGWGEGELEERGLA